MSKIWTAALSVVISLQWSLVVAQTQFTVASASGTVEGTMLNEKGKPVVDAAVNVDNGKPTIGAIRYFRTDKKGHFVIDHLAWGKYKVFAQKESEGYPDSTWAFYSDNVFKPHRSARNRLRRWLSYESGHLVECFITPLWMHPLGARLTRVSPCAEHQIQTSLLAAQIYQSNSWCLLSLTYWLRYPQKVMSLGRQRQKGQRPVKSV
jgi:hypothetical protein